MNATFKVTLKAVNNKSLVKSITDYIEDGIKSLGVGWNNESHRSAFVQIIEEFLENLLEAEEKIEQYKVVCDRRNNKIIDMERSIYSIDVEFKQKHCLNKTKIHYFIRASSTTPLVGDPDFLI